MKSFEDAAMHRILPSDFDMIEEMFSDLVADLEPCLQLINRKHSCGVRGFYFLDKHNDPVGIMFGTVHDETLFVFSQSFRSPAEMQCCIRPLVWSKDINEIAIQTDNKQAAKGLLDAGFSIGVTFTDETCYSYLKGK